MGTTSELTIVDHGASKNPEVVDKVKVSIGRGVSGSMDVEAIETGPNTESSKSRRNS